MDSDKLEKFPNDVIKFNHALLGKYQYLLEFQIVSLINLYKKYKLEVKKIRETNNQTPAVYIEDILTRIYNAYTVIYNEYENIVNINASQYSMIVLVCRIQYNIIHYCNAKAIIEFISEIQKSYSDKTIESLKSELENFEERNSKMINGNFGWIDKWLTDTSEIMNKICPLINLPTVLSNGEFLK